MHISFVLHTYRKRKILFCCAKPVFEKANIIWVLLLIININTKEFEIIYQ